MPDIAGGAGVITLGALILGKAIRNLKESVSIYNKAIGLTERPIPEPNYIISFRGAIYGVGLTFDF